MFEIYSPLVCNGNYNPIQFLHAKAGKEIISNKQAEKCVKALMELSKSNIKIVEQEDILEEAFNIAIRNNLTIYDAVYIALAGKLKTTLITRDRKQAESAKKEEISVIEL